MKDKDPWGEFEKDTLNNCGKSTNSRDPNLVIDQEKLLSTKTDTSKPLKSEEISPFTLHLKELQRRVPIVGDKALIDLVNGIQVGAETVRYRKQRGFFGRLMDTLNGSDRQRELLIEGNLISGQETLHELILELNNSLDISRVGLEITQQSLEVTQKSLLEARNAIRLQKQALDKLTQLIEQIRHTFEESIHRLEVRMTAKEDFDKIVTAWMAETTYIHLPWAVQITLLIREIFNSSVSAYELGSGNTHYRQHLINKLVAESKHREAPKQFNGLGDLLDCTYEKMKSQDDHELSASLLETRSVQLKHVIPSPHLFTVGMALELAMLTDAARPVSPGLCAIELCRNQVGNVTNITTQREFITAIVEETADECFAVMSLSTVHRRG
ncbi:MAG: hypothetical protein KME64_04115 [Scytonematopsis contorta HA4267-MV1]|jgi:hypothetical protein|nr:hypothetical protein [Scytonematopsis contorta HA4267-MV1]